MPVVLGLISILGALLINVSFDAEKVEYVGIVDKAGKVMKCEAIKPENKEAIVTHIKSLQESNSVNGQEHMYETGNVYSYEFFNKMGGGQVFTLTKKECQEGINRILLNSSKARRNG